MKELHPHDSNNIVFGKNSVLELIGNSNVQVNKIYISNSLNDSKIRERITLFAKKNKIPFYFVPNEKLNNLTNDKNHQGIVLSISPIKYVSIEELIENQKIILIPHEIEDTHNLGAMIRTFVAGGGKGVILTGRSNVGINATVIKTSSGALFQAEFARATNCVNVLNELKKSGFWIVGADNSKQSQSLYKVDLPEKVAILVGNEHEGLGELIKKNCDFLVKIPINDKVDSLNVSVAFGIILFELLRKNHRLGSLT